MKKGQLGEAVMLFLITAFFIHVLWQALELYFYGETQPNTVDSIIAISFYWMAWLAYALGIYHGKH